MFKNFLDRVEFKTKRIQNLIMFRNFDESVNKETGDMITKKILSLII